MLGYGDNAIHFEDGLIDMVDGGYSSNAGWVAMQWASTGKKFLNFGYGTITNENTAYVTLESLFYNGETLEGEALFSVATHANATSYSDYVEMIWKAGSTTPNQSWYYYDNGSFDINGFVSFADYIKFGIPTWYGTKTTATNKYPNWSDWTDAEDCPNSNIWIWLKSSGTPAYVLYFKTPHDQSTYSYWVALNRYTL